MLVTVREERHMVPRPAARKEPIELSIKGFHEDGQGMGQYKGKKVLVWGALPGERVLVDVRKRRKGYLHGVAVDVIEPSSFRVEAEEDHCLSCSPWQVLHPEKERESKELIAGEIFKREAGVVLPGHATLVEGRRPFGYRNKMEFSFTTGQEGELSLAFHERLLRRRTPIEGCVLAREEINRFAREVLDALRRKGIQEQALKTLILRANSKGRTLGALFVKDENMDAGAFGTGFPEGLSVYFSEPRRSASVPTRLLLRSGGERLTEELTIPEGKGTVTLSMGLLSFFQVNVEVFQMALRDMAPFLEGADLVEYYSGVGAISIGLSGTADIKKALLVDSDTEAIGYAEENIRANGLEERYEAHAVSAEKMRDELRPERMVLLDPPRAGIHPKLLKRMTEVIPRRIVYLSCNIKTQARDVRELLPSHDIVFSRRYNFFPRTPHVESLMVLDRKGS
jgi:23S rRNA (uracil1939-C5)-methyltransferase